jgi:ribosome-binding protein aMBF1 (putative translation factor)
MLKSTLELVDDYALRITAARKAKGWNQATLGKRMAETVNIIKSTESGKRPTDSVLKKFERVLSITLYEASTPSQTQRVDTSTGRGMTLGDYLDDLR